MRLRLAITLLGGMLAAGCASTLQDAPVHIARPIELGTDAESLARDGRFYFSAQPSPETLRRLADRGVVKVVDLRTDAEKEGAEFNEANLVEALGMEYVQIPFPKGEPPTDGVARRLAEELAITRGPALIHCGSSNRAGAAWGRYLRLFRGFSPDAAALRARAAGMTSEEYEAWVRSPVGDREGDRL